MPLQVSVSNLELFRIWKADEDLDLEWLLSRLRGEGETENMRAGHAFHEALERVEASMELGCLAAGEYRFDFNCDVTIAVPKLREMPIEKQYGDLLVRGRVDNLFGKTVTDYKTTEQFDADRLWSGYQWRFYLDMLEADRFIWQVFVIKPEDDNIYVVRDFHTLQQSRYPALHTDCQKLANEYLEFSRQVEIPTRGQAA